MTSLAPTVVVIGDALLDVTAHPATPIRPGADVPADVRIGCGGQGANLAVRLARRGVTIELVCALGDDPGGTLVRDALARESVALSVVTTEATGGVVILLDDQGERTMLSRRAPFAADVTAALRSDVPWLVVSGYLLLESASGELARALAGMSARLAIVGCAVPSQIADRWANAAAAMRPDLVVLNREEAVTLLPAGSGTDELPVRLAERLASGVVVTDRFGASARLNGLSAAVRAPTEAATVDTTGAGDAFAAGLIAALLAGPWPPTADTLEAALMAAGELASSVTTVAGAQGRVAGEPAFTVRP